MASSSSNNKPRRSNKPLMEKRRRERINKSLNSLKELVLKAEHKDVSKFNKLEKADILEMTLRHVRSLHENSSNTSSKSGACIIKYKEGFERCISEILSYFNGVGCVASEKVSSVISHLRSISDELNKETRCSHGNKGESKVKAAIDRSVFTSGVLRLEQVDEERGSSPGISNFLVKKENNLKLDYIYNIVNSTHSFPPSPPDSLRGSSSPDSLRGSPKNFLDHAAPINGMDKLYTSNSCPAIINTDKNSFQYTLETEGTPLNLTMPSHSSRQEVRISASERPFYPLQCSSPSSHIIVKREPSSPSSYPPSSSFPTQQGKVGNLNGSQIGNALPLEAGGPSWRGHSLKTENRPTPYPKKEAVKRYQNQNPSGIDQIHGNAPPFQAISSMSHWRPW